MSYLTVREGKLVRVFHEEKKTTSVMEKAAGLYHKINDYYGVQEGTSDVVWFYGLYIGLPTAVLSLLLFGIAGS